MTGLQMVTTIFSSVVKLNIAVRQRSFRRQGLNPKFWDSAKIHRKSEDYQRHKENDGVIAQHPSTLKNNAFLSLEVCRFKADMHVTRDAPRAMQLA